PAVAAESPRNGPSAAVAVAVDPPPAAGADPPGLPVDLEGLRAVWPAVLETLRASNALCAALVADSEPVAVTDGVVTVAFPAGADFRRRKAEDDAYRACVVAAIRTVTGRPARVAYELRSDEPPATGPAAARAAPTEEEWVARFVAEFDAEEIHPEPHSESEIS
ncbi:MAG: hypothetical protein M3296_09020, partial [Actinomycetota bacterium]|nr:hypothetical protein [Actinomycetota bacterium]